MSLSNGSTPKPTDLLDQSASSTQGQTATPQTSKNWKTPEFKSCTRMQQAYDRCNELTQYPSVIGGLAR